MTTAIRITLCLTLAFTATATAQVQIDLSAHEAASGIQLTRDNNTLRAQWQSANNTPRSLTLDLQPNAPLLHSIELSGKPITPPSDLQFILTAGSRTTKGASPQGYIFFDKPSQRPTQRHLAKLDPRSVKARSSGRRTTLTISTLTAGPFSGDLLIHFYSGSPLIHVEAALSTSEPNLAYIYDAVLLAPFNFIAFENLDGQMTRIPPEGAPRSLPVRHRAIMAESPAGTLALFPPPHAFFFPRDYTNNFGFAQVGANLFGLRQDPAGGGAFAPWFDATPNKTHKLGLFLLATSDPAEKTLELVKRYTNNDSFKPLPGHLTFTSHYHSRLAVAELAGKRTVVPEFVRVMKDMGVNIVHLAEFHGDGNPYDPGPKRLPQLKMMFDICRQHSDDTLLLLPGEEGNKFLGNPRPGQHPGHWMYLFPRNVYLTFTRAEGQPFEETIDPYGTVYHVGSRQDMFELLKKESGLAWTTHPRIKASNHAPDAFKDQDFYLSDHWLGAAWKAMPGDLSDDRLGRRCLDLLDDMNNWGQRKYLPGEVDVFELDRTHELYGHMNINYLKLDKLPTPADWTPVLDCLKRGDFFVTTGEILIHTFDVKDGQATADLEWTFPLQFAEVIWGDGQKTHRKRIDLPDTAEFGRQRFTWPVELKDARWYRLEVWDTALNGAFTQPRTP